VKNVDDSDAVVSGALLDAETYLSYGVGAVEAFS
jgi:hypothetical protein